jgi:hypothetical protein
LAIEAHFLKPVAYAITWLQEELASVCSGARSPVADRTGKPPLRFSVAGRVPADAGSGSQLVTIDPAARALWRRLARPRPCVAGQLPVGAGSGVAGQLPPYERRQVAVSTLTDMPGLGHPEPPVGTVLPAMHRGAFLVAEPLAIAGLLAVLAWLCVTRRWSAEGSGDPR